MHLVGRLHKAGDPRSREVNNVPFLARKITRAKWDRRDGLAENEIPADAVTADLRTTNNTLSFWKCEAPSDEEIRQTVLALATEAERVDRIDVVWVEEDDFRAHSISLNPSDGRTPVASLRSRHVDVAKLDLGRLSVAATLLAQALAQGQHRRTQTVNADHNSRRASNVSTTRNPQANTRSGKRFSTWRPASVPKNPAPIMANSNTSQGR